MQIVPVIILVGTALIIAVPLLMLGVVLFLFGSRGKTLLSEEARQRSIQMTLSHFSGFALFVASNAIPVQQMSLRVFAACFGILLLGVVPSLICVSLIRRQAIPTPLFPLGWSVAGMTGLLSLILGYIVWGADQAVRMTATSASG